MKKFASILMAALLAMMLMAPAFAADGPSIGRTDPVEVEQRPAPNAPGAPDFVVVVPPAAPATADAPAPAAPEAEEETEPETYVRVEDPESEDPENPEYMYVPEDEVPLADAPEGGVKETVEDGIAGLGKAEAAHVHFGDPTCWMILILSALVGLIVGVVVGRVSKRKKDDDDDKNAEETAAK